MNRFHRAVIRLIFVPCLLALLFVFARFPFIHAQNELSDEIAVTTDQIVVMRDGVGAPPPISIARHETAPRLTASFR
jgi:hypothetical protein